MTARRRGNVIDHRQRALLVGLHRETKPVPLRERGIGQQQIDNVERKLKPVGLLGIDGEVQIVPFGQSCELSQLAARARRAHADATKARSADATPRA